MVSDTSFEELHAFAAALGIPRERFQRDHYDLPPILRARAVAQGAEQVTISDLAQRMAGPRGERNRARRRPPGRRTRLRRLIGVSFQRGIDGPEPVDAEGVGGRIQIQDERRTRSTRLGVGTLACPRCDAPVALAGPRLAGRRHRLPVLRRTAPRCATSSPSAPRRAPRASSSGWSRAAGPRGADPARRARYSGGCAWTVRSRAAASPTTSSTPHSATSRASGIVQLPVAACSSPVTSGPVAAIR